mgnify:CR=1 FL=1
MKIGDKVLLKDIPANDIAKLEPYKDKVGEIINHDNVDPPEFIRVSFDGKFYEDMLAWRVFLL